MALRRLDAHFWGGHPLLQCGVFLFLVSGSFNVDKAFHNSAVLVFSTTPLRDGTDRDYFLCAGIGVVEKIAALFAATELWEGALSCSKNQEPLNAKARKKGIRAGRSERTARPIC